MRKSKNQKTIAVVPCTYFLIIGALGMFMGLVLGVLPNIIKRSTEEES